MSTFLGTVCLCLPFGFSFIFSLTGIAGPRGRAGKPGMNGNHGIPGVQAWGVTINGTRSSELLIPPKIVGLFCNLFLIFV